MKAGGCFSLYTKQFGTIHAINGLGAGPAIEILSVTEGAKIKPHHGLRMRKTDLYKSHQLPDDVKKFIDEIER